MKLFRKPCFNESQVVDAINAEKKLALAKEKPVLTEQEYEYVRREHGFDYMPPSQYVPSHSIEDDSVDDIHNPVRIEVPGSDLSGSLGDEVYVADYNPYGSGPKKSPRMPVKSAPNQPKHLSKHQSRQPSVEKQHVHHLSKHQSRQPSVEKQHVHHQARRSGSGSAEDPYKGNTPRNKEVRREPARQRSQRKGQVRSPYDDEPSPSRDQAFRKQASVEKPKRREPPASKPQRKETDKRAHRKKGTPTPTENQYSDEGDIKRVPTAFSYNSEDSGESLWDERSKHSRYEIDDKEEDVPTTPSRARNNKKKGSGWGESDRDFNDYWRQKRTGNGYEEEEYTEPPAATYRSRDRGESPPRRRDLRESRFEPEEQRRNHHATEIREELVIERQPAPYDMQRRRSAPTELTFEAPVEREFRGTPRMSSTPPQPQQHTAQQGGKKKNKGFFGRMRDSVRGDKGKKAIAKTNKVPHRREGDREWKQTQNLREKGSLFERTPPSVQSDMSPPYPYESRVPYPYDDYERPRRGRSDSLPQDYEGVRHEGGRQRPANGRAPQHDEYWEDPPANMPRTRSSGAMPFESARGPTPPIRYNPDYRHRQVPIAKSMTKHYKGNHLAGVAQPVRAGRGKTQVTRLHFSEAQAAAVPKQKGNIGCY